MWGIAGIPHNLLCFHSVVHSYKFTCGHHEGVDMFRGICTSMHLKQLGATQPAAVVCWLLQLDTWQSRWDPFCPPVLCLEGRIHHWQNLHFPIGWQYHPTQKCNSHRNSVMDVHKCLITVWPLSFHCWSGVFFVVVVSFVLFLLYKNSFVEEQAFLSKTPC